MAQPPAQYRPMTHVDIPVARYIHHSAGDANRMAAGRPATPFEAEPMPWIDHAITTDPAGCWVATIGETPVGFATSLIRGATWHLSTLFVHADFHGHGIGAELMRLAICYADAAGIANRCLSASNSLPAQALYMRHGMHALALSYVLDTKAEALRALPPPGPGRTVVRDLAPLQDSIDALDESVGRGRRPMDHARFRAPGSMWGDGEDGWFAIVDAAGLCGYGYASTSEGHMGPFAGREPGDIPQLLHVAGLWFQEHDVTDVYGLFISANATAMEAMIGGGARAASFNTYMATSGFIDFSRYTPSSGLLL